MLQKLGWKSRLLEIKVHPAIQCDPFAQPPHGALTVLRQRASFFRLAYNAGGEMTKANSGLNLVPALAAGPACPITFLSALFDQSARFKTQASIAL
jgi:hypothetical protein